MVVTGVGKGRGYGGSGGWFWLGGRDGVVKGCDSDGGGEEKTVERGRGGAGGGGGSGTSSSAPTLTISAPTENRVIGRE